MITDCMLQSILQLSRHLLFFLKIHIPRIICQYVEQIISAWLDE